MKTFITYAFLTLLSFMVNFAIYNYSFNTQATPYLHEEQRVDSGILMLKITMPAFLVSSIIFAIIFYMLSKKIMTKKSNQRDT
ncbi:hypothetical protein FKG94_08465 [Exilibacterium tricleocarpae]|uniref:Uncharacterized protein n=1 Tax=Exilibacterium tricleocarpae TaxID=2591008 RepID=A0A545TV98_9GAMM|nr:hypothetical protein [Exilibacterium tricleocarpae]TQV81134.1 hypothetical protein FKG94_08465 [Exilibacterium tricleocarpae]